MALSYKKFSINIYFLLLISVIVQSAPVTSDQQRNENSTKLCAKSEQFFCIAVPLKNLAGNISVST